MSSTEFVYVKKITMSLGFLRRLTAVVDEATGEILRPASPACPLMRIRGRTTEGWVETAEYGDFIRWIGVFGAEIIQRDGSIQTYMSRNLILPPVAADYVATQMRSTQKEITAKGRTGEHYSPVGDFEEVEFMTDIWIGPPAAGGKRGSSTGYEFFVRPVLDASKVNPLAQIASSIKAPAFGVGTLEGPVDQPTTDDRVPAAPAPEAETIPMPVPEAETIPMPAPAPDTENVTRHGKRHAA